MIKVSELLGKNVIALHGAQLVGTASNLIFDKKLQKVKYINVLRDLEPQSLESAFVAIKSIKDLNADALAINNTNAVLDKIMASNNSANSPINSLAFNQDGRALGRVSDIELDGIEVINIVIDGLKLHPKKILSNSDSILIFNDTNKNIKLIAPKKTAAVKSVSVLADEPIQKNCADKTIDIEYPTRVPSDKTFVSRSPASKDSLARVYGFLLGKTLARHLYDDKMGLIAKQHSTITLDTIESAKSHSKMVQLALYAD